MIRISMTRDRDGEHFDQGTREVEPMSALRTLVQAELAFGGEITEATGTRLTVVTRVLSCVDTTIFEGSADEMAVLNQTVYFYLQACQERDTVMEGVLADLARIPDGKGGVPLIINLAAPMLMGRNRLALATMMALGITEESDIAAGMLMGMDNLLAAYQLMQEFPGMTLAEVSAATAVDKAA
jgi:hypothetical protein